MDIESGNNLNEYIRVNTENIEKVLTSEYFIVHCDSGIETYLRQDDAEKIDDIKIYLDKTLGVDSNFEEQKIKAYLFSNKERYLEFMQKNYPNVPDGSATFDQKTNSVFAYSPADIKEYRGILGDDILTDQEVENIIRGRIFSIVAHESAHLHSPFNGVGNEDSKNKWEQEMICTFLEDKTSLKFDEKFDENIKRQAREYLANLQSDNEIFSWEEAGAKWDDFTKAERFVYFWLEKQYGLKKLQDLWSKMFKDKRTISEAVKEVYEKDIHHLEEEFQNEMLSSKKLFRKIEKQHNYLL